MDYVSMSEVIIKQDQIQVVDQHGIHFINDDGEEDFIAFALSYECLMYIALNFDPDEFRDDEYDKFLEKIPYLQIVAIYDDFLNEFDLYFAQDTTGDLIYKLILDDQAAYEKFSARVTAFGWEICPSSELW